MTNRTVLGTAVLLNDGEYSNMVETVITYEYEKVTYWGTCEGVTRGLQTEVFENGKTAVKFGWGLKDVENRTEVCFIYTNIYLNFTIYNKQHAK